MSSRTPTEEKAIAWFCQEFGLIPQLSAHPTYYFRKKETGGEFNRHIDFIVNDYKASLEDGKKASSKR